MDRKSNHGKRYGTNKIFFLLLWGFFLGAVLTALPGCRSNSVYVFSEEDAITDEEKEAIIAYIRYFVNRSNLNLSKAERSYIRTVPPVFKIHYTGKKRGDLVVRWKFPNHRTLILKRSGHLLFEGRIHWDVRLLTDYATPTLPRGSFGSKGEDIRILRPEVEEVLKQWQGDPPPGKK